LGEGVVAGFFLLKIEKLKYLTLDNRLEF